MFLEIREVFVKYSIFVTTSGFKEEAEREPKLKSHFKQLAFAYHLPTEISIRWTQYT